MTSSRRLSRGLLLAAFLGFLTACSAGGFAQARPAFVGDPSFGSGGLVTGGIGQLNLSATVAPRALAKDAQGRVIFGVASGGQWLVRRFLPHGNLDPSFGDQGEVVITTWGPYEASAANLTSGVIRPDGRILLVGFAGSDVVGNNVRRGDASMILKQLMPDGSPDLTFGHVEGGNLLGAGKGAVRIALCSMSICFVAARSS